MTREELRELYSHCIYCELDDDVEKELSEWELNEVFIPIIEEMIDEGYEEEQVEGFVECCYFEYFMSDITLYALINKCDLDIYAEDPFSSDVYSAWKDNGYFLKVKAMNKN